MIRHLVALGTALRTANHGRTARFAIAVARRYEDTPIGDYATSLAEQEVRRALHADARTHVKRLGAPVI